MEPRVTNRSSYIEVEIGLPGLRSTGVLDLLARAIDQFGHKHILVLCDDPRQEMNLAQAYAAGIEVAKLAPTGSVAIVLRGRRASDTEHFTELVARNRGARVRYFDDPDSALEWLKA